MLQIMSRRGGWRIPALFLSLVIILAPSVAAARNVTVLVDVDAGAILRAEGANALWYPASLTKMMTAFMVFEAAKAGKIHFSDKITVSANAAGQSPTKFGLKKGQKITVEQALTAMLVVSGNDAAVALAEAIGGTEERFAQMMTATAHRIGMTRTEFRNASGLPHAGQVTTARDMAELALHILESYPEHYPLFGKRSVTIAGRTQPSVNGILSSYQGADGMKTGFTCGSGYNLVASAKRNGRRLIGVVLGASSRGERAALMTQLLNAGFQAQAAEMPKLKDMTIKISAEELGPPPTLLKGGDCDQRVAEDGNSTITTAARISGWGIVFGAFPQKTQAETTISRMKSRLKGTIKKGRPAIIQRTWEGLTRYSALLVGLDQAEAGKACKQVWADNGYCLALSPAVLSNPDAEWR
ncbi:D-alanyl-D-alanine carboxypeptidase family protein [Dongia sp.]|uniref:D-alanyl-D-alanine carboxypeptidase family protein n=1 Tax=Dongia sp. TaxID=1977262 RepID=UPI0035B0AF40